MAKEKKKSTQEITISEIESLRTKAENGQLGNSDSTIIINLCNFSLHLLQLIDDKDITIARLRKSVFGSKSEKNKFEQTQQNQQNSPQQNQQQNQDQNLETYHLEESPQDNEAQPKPLKEGVVTDLAEEKKKRKGHGRLSASQYVGAKTLYCLNTELRPKDDCPHQHCTGNLYDTNEPQVLIKSESRPIIDATLYKRQVLRCGRCGDRFTASLPNGINEDRYDVSADVMIAILHYSGALPFNRLERIQQMMGVPLPASNQYERSEEVAKAAHPIYLELERQSAKLDVLHTDDTKARILSLIKENKTLSEKERKGMYTTGIVASSTEVEIALYYSGRRYSGENLSELLKKRPKESTKLILMGDAESKNWTLDYVAIIANCLVHARRQFLDCRSSFEECDRVIADIGKVYKIESQTKNMTPAQRLAYHQEHSLPIMHNLKDWLNQLIEQRKIQPNSAMGKAIGYINRHWKKLTQFLQTEGCPLDNNAAERILRKIVVLRKNSLFFKTQNGADTADVLTSVIETCCLNNTNPFDYLMTVMNNKKQVRANPHLYLPWNYQLQKDKVA